LIVVEVGLSIVLLTSAGLMIQTFWRLSHLNLGFDCQPGPQRAQLAGAAQPTPRARARRNHFATAAAQNWQRSLEWNRWSAVSFPPPLDPIAPTHFTAWRGEASDPGRDCTAHTLVVLPRYFETPPQPDF